ADQRWARPLPPWPNRRRRPTAAPAERSPRSRSRSRSLSLLASRPVRTATSGSMRCATARSRSTPGGAFTAFSVPPQDGATNDSTSGQDGNPWLMEEEEGNGKIGRVTPRGAVTDFPLPTADCHQASPTGDIACLPSGITSEPDGNVWFTEDNKIGRIALYYGFYVG